MTFTILSDNIPSYHVARNVPNSAFESMREQIYNHVVNYIKKESTREKKGNSWFGFYSSSIKKERVAQAEELLDIVSTSLDHELMICINRAIFKARRGLLNRSSLFGAISHCIQNRYLIVEMENQSLKNELNKLSNDLNCQKIDLETLNRKYETLKDQYVALNEAHQRLLLERFLQ